MPEEASLKRPRNEDNDNDDSQKKPRRSERLPAPSHVKDDGKPFQTHLPSPVTRKASNSTEEHLSQTPAKSQADRQPTPPSSPQQASGLNSPPSDTQPFSQFIPPVPISYEVEDEEAEGVWGYLIPVGGGAGNNDTLVLRRRAACPVSREKVGRTTGKERVSSNEYKAQEEDYEKEKAEKGVPAGGYLIGRHVECGE